MPLRLMIGLENTGKRGGGVPCGPASRLLAQRHGELVVDPAMRRIPLPGVAVLGRNIGGGLDVREILQAPGIGFADRHESDDGGRTTEDRERCLITVVRHLSVRPSEHACTQNRPSVQTLSGDQPLPRASAWNNSTVYL